jgi:hypothetical protein
LVADVAKDRSWIITCIVGVTVVAACGFAVWIWLEKSEYNEKRQYDRHTQSESPYGICLKIPLLVDSCSSQTSDAANQKKREDDDLAAQQEMADWAFWVALVSVPGLILSVGGLALIFGTLQKTSEAIFTADKNSRDETRAYVHIGAAELTWGSGRNPNPAVTLTAINAGQTPAKWFMVRSRIVVRELDENGFDQSGFDPSSVDFSDRKWKPWSALGGGESLSLPSYHPDDIATLKSSFQNRQKVSVNVVGTIRYETVLSETFETDFWFTRRPMPGYSETEISRSEIGGAVNIQTKENPRPLQRANGIMRTYSAVDT